MAEDNKERERESRTERSTTTTTANPTTAKATEGTVKVELIAKSWMERREDGSYRRHTQGAVLDVPESIYKRLAEDHFKPSFRKVEKSE